MIHTKFQPYSFYFQPLLPSRHFRGFFSFSLFPPSALFFTLRRLQLHQLVCRFRLAHRLLRFLLLWVIQWYSSFLILFVGRLLYRHFLKQQKSARDDYIPLSSLVRGGVSLAACVLPTLTYRSRGGNFGRLTKSYFQSRTYFQWINQNHIVLVDFWSLTNTMIL